MGDGSGHIQSLVLGSTLLTLGVITIIIGFVSDLINFNRKLLEKMLHRMEKLEEYMGMNLHVRGSPHNLDNANRSESRKNGVDNEKKRVYPEFPNKV